MYMLLILVKAREMASLGQYECMLGDLLMGLQVLGVELHLCQQLHGPLHVLFSLVCHLVWATEIASSLLLVMIRRTELTTMETYQGMG
jgi:hypothetical protein